MSQAAKANMYTIPINIYIDHRLVLVLLCRFWATRASENSEAARSLQGDQELRLTILMNFSLPVIEMPQRFGGVAS
jgi:hypothetical protein